jgi:hypothetical protein
MRRPDAYETRAAHMKWHPRSRQLGCHVPGKRTCPACPHRALMRHNAAPAPSLAVGFVRKPAE